MTPQYIDNELIYDEVCDFIFVGDFRYWTSIDLDMY